MASERGPSSWPFPVEGGGTSGFIVVNGERLDETGAPFGVSKEPAGNIVATLARTGLAQSVVISPYAPIGASPDVFSISVPGISSLDWKTLERAHSLAQSRVLARWPVSDRWGLPGEVGQRQTFFLSRYLPPASDLLPSEWTPYLEAEFFPNGGPAVPLSVITSGTPADDELLLADEFLDFDDVASYSASTGDLSALGPGQLVLRYDATRFGQLSLARTVPTFNALSQVVTFTEALPRRTWADSLN